MSGIVYLVGAGPGDPRLITLRGAEVLRTADVIIYDRLASPALLDLAPARAERIFAGKAPGERALEQEAINRLIVEHARAGKVVVRLKGGDPFVFGRGGEEALACARAGIAFEVVPGVTSAIAAPAAVGIPLTQRGLASSVAFVTGTLASGESPDLAALARSVDTLVVLMAAGKLGEICERLIEAGRPPDQPAAIVEWATTSWQQSVVATLEDLPDRAAALGIGAPATLVVGEVAALAEDLGGENPSQTRATPAVTRSG